MGYVVQDAPLFEMFVVEVKGFLLIVQFDKLPHERFYSLVEVEPQLHTPLSLN